MGEMETLSVDIVVPLYNDEEVVELLCETVLNTIGDKFQSVRLILVDDGSKDGTNLVARKISQEKEVALKKSKRQTKLYKIGTIVGGVPIGILIIK